MKICSHFSEELYLTNETGRELYHKYAEKLPIIDYHCHISAEAMVENREFEDLGEMWLEGDHYKWRAMRAFGIDEKYITGSAPYHDKYLAFAKVLPKMVGNPLPVWCALELKRYFDIDEPLSDKNAEEIYQRTKQLIHEKHMTRRWCMEHSNVRLVSTTEDPIDDLRWHKQLAADPSLKIRVITAFRPDQAMFLEQRTFGEYLARLGQAAGVSIRTFADLLRALENRLVYFRETTGTTVSDDGVPKFVWQDYTDEEIERIFEKAARGEQVTEQEKDQYQSAFLFEMGKLYNKHHYVMQLHIGTYLDANTVGVRNVGKSTGFDCIDDRSSVVSVGELLNALTMAGQLPRTILYPLNGTECENWAVLAGGFCDGKDKAHVQLGAPWWFHDQQYGIERQFRSCANLYPISLSVGMLTDSRSFISYPRHELYRRVFCNYLGELCERGEYIGTEENLAQIIRGVCFDNVNEFFDFHIAEQES